MNTLKQTPAWLDLLRSGGFGITGGDIHSEADAIVTQLGDGTSLKAMWEEVKEVLRIWNNNQNPLVRLLSFPTTSVADHVPQSISGESLELASEFGVPRGMRADPSMLVGYDFLDFDISSRASWRFLRSADQGQVRQIVNRVMAADTKLLTGTVLNRLFDQTEGLNPENLRVYPLWTGQDGLAPLRHMSTEFPSSHSHYLVSGGSVIDSEDLESLIRTVAHHGYGREQGSQLLILCSETELEEISKFRAGIANNNTKVAKYDFISGKNAPPYLTSQSIVGATPPGDLEGLPIAGQYGPAWVLQHELIPAGYVACVASAGADSPSNLMGFRQHPNPSYQGLRPIPGVGPYPLQEHFYSRGFGVGVRHRGAAAVMQIKPSGGYVAPEIPT